MGSKDTVHVLESAEVAYDVAMRRIDEQMRQVDALDNRIGVIIGTSSALAALFAGFASVAVQTESRGSLWTGVAFITLVVLSYVLAVSVASVGLIMHREWDVRPNWDELLSFGRDYSDQVMRSWVADACVLSLKENLGRIRIKLALFGWSIRFLICEAVVAAAGLVAIVAANAAAN
jgi:hypothetical protein